MCNLMQNHTFLQRRAGVRVRGGINIEGKQNREPVMRALIEDAGGKFIGFYGLIGRPEGDGVVISDFDKLSDYMSVVAKTMLSGAISDITTAHCYTGEDVVAASTKAAGMEYKPPTP